MQAHTSPLVSSPRELESPVEASSPRQLSFHSCRGRAPLLPTPDVEPSTLWAEALDSFEIYLVALGRTENGLRNRLYSVRAMARHATSTGREPADISKAAMTSYLLQQYKDRKGMGHETLYQELKNFWTWWAAEYEGTSPIAGIPRPGGQSAVVPVLTRSRSLKSSDHVPGTPRRRRCGTWPSYGSCWSPGCAASSCAGWTWMTWTCAAGLPSCGTARATGPVSWCLGIPARRRSSGGSGSAGRMQVPCSCRCAVTGSPRVGLASS